MPKQVTRTTPELDNTLQDLEISFTVDPGDQPLAQRIRVRVAMNVTEDDGIEFRESVSAKLNDSIPTFTAGDAAALRALLAKCFNAGRKALSND